MIEVKFIRRFKIYRKRQNFSVKFKQFIEINIACGRKKGLITNELIELVANSFIFKGLIKWQYWKLNKIFANNIFACIENLIERKTNNRTIRKFCYLGEPRCRS